MAPILPRRVGHYDVLGELGRGGMGIVYRVRDRRTSQLAAMKIIPPEALARPEAAMRFKREFRAMQRVRHPNVIRVFESGTHEGCPFFTMELIEGKDIRAWLDGDDAIVKTGGGPPPAGLLSEEQRSRLNDPRRVRRLAEAIVQVGFAISAIHAHRIVHRDLKPDNILVSKAGVVKLMDFGIAKQLSAHTEHSSGGMVVGTFKYLSPEQALGADIDGRADLYCLGVILYELLAGRHPFYSENSVGYAYHHARKPPPPIDRFNPEVDPGLKAICERLIEKDPNDRFPTAEDLIAAIRGAVDGLATERSQKQKPARGKEPYPAKHNLFAPALVGRERESRGLLALCEQTKQGRGSVAVITGARGIGKSRLVREVVGQARGLDVDVVVGRALKEAGGAYQPYLEVLDHLVAEAAMSHPDEVHRFLGAEGPVLARYLTSIERLPGPRPSPAGALDPAGERARFLGAVSGFLERAAAGRPRVVVVDDLHEADELSLDLTRHLAETIAGIGPVNESGAHRMTPLSLVVTVDPSAQPSRGARNLLSELKESQAVLALDLAPLGPADVGEMLQTMIGGGDVAEVLGEALHQDTGGVPGRVEERIRAWAESGELRKKGREWVLIRPKSPPTQGAPLPPPVDATQSLPGISLEDDSDSQVVQLRAATRADIPAPDLDGRPADRRVQRLGKVALDVGERAAIVGERVGADLIARIALRPEEELLDALDELIKSDILVEDPEGSEYRFAGSDERDALLRGLPEERRKHLHALVANVLEDEGRRRRRPVNPEVLARHYLEAGEPLKALDQLMNAARRALEASATQTAAERVREAQELFLSESQGRPFDPSMARRDVDLVLLRLDVLAAIGEHKECVALARRRLPRLRGAIDPRLVGEVLLRLASSERVLGELDGALEHVGEALRITERGGAHSLRCRAKSLCGHIYEQRGQYEHSQRYFSDALELARAIGDELEEEHARSALAGRGLETGDLETAERAFKRLLDVAEARGERLRISKYVNALGIIAHERAEYDKAEAAYRRMIELAKPAGDRRGVAVGLGNIGVVRRDEGRYQDALHLVSKAARILRDIDDVESFSYVRIVEAQILLDKGDDARALEQSEEAKDLADKASSALRKAEALICRGLARARLGDVEEARGDVREGLDTARAVNANRVVLWGLLAAAEVEQLAGDVAAAQRLTDEGLGRARRTAYTRFIRRFEALAPKVAAS